MARAGGPVSGAWKRSPRTTGAYVDRVGAYRRNWGTPVDPDHLTSEQPDPGWPAPVPRPPGESTWVPPFLEDFFDPSGDPLPYFPEAEREPEGHDGPNVPNGGVREPKASRVAHEARSVYRGADTSRDRPRVMRQWDQTHQSEMRQSLPPTPMGVDGGSLTGQALRALRGDNSLALNNPGDPAVNFSGNYSRQGNELYRWVDRKMPMNTITPTLRVLHGNWAAGDRVTDPVESPYTSYLPGGAGLTAGVGPQSPYQRREPRPWDEDVVRDGSEQDDEQFYSWGL